MAEEQTDVATEFPETHDTPEVEQAPAVEDHGVEGAPVVKEDDETDEEEVDASKPVALQEGVELRTSEDKSDS